MTKIKAIILDLDNTIYAAPAVGETLFKPLLKLIEDSGDFKGDFEEIKAALVKKPFQRVAEEHEFSDTLSARCIAHLSDLTCDVPMEAFDDYTHVKTLPCRKYLVTTGFTKLQRSKIDQLHIQDDFDKIYIVDPSKTDLTKRDIFRQILVEAHYMPEEVLVVGDDLESEIKAANELGIASLWYNNVGQAAAAGDHKMIHSFRELQAYVD